MIRSNRRIPVGLGLIIIVILSNFFVVFPISLTGSVKDLNYSMDSDLANASASFIDEDSLDYSGRSVASAGDVWEEDITTSTRVVENRRNLDPLTNPYLYHAESAARWLISIAVMPSPGQFKWYVSDLDSSYYSLDLSVGASGIGTFFTKLYTETGNDTYKRYAEGAARWIISQEVPTGPESSKWSRREGWVDYAVDKFAGAGAIGEFLLELWKATDNDTYLDYSEKAAHWLMDIAISQYGGYKWETIPGFDFNFTGWAHGVAGIGDFFRKLYIATDDESYLEYAEGSARWLIATARTPGPMEYAWVRIETDNSTSPSWCGGTPGIVQYMLLLYETTKNGTYLDYAKGGGNHMIALSTEEAPGQVTIYSTNMFCHGNPSTSYVFFMLYNATQNTTYLRYAEDNANWTLVQGVKVSEHEMKWPSLRGTEYYETTLLRGVSGIGHHMVYAYNVTKNERYLDYAKKAANWVGNTSIEVSPGVEKWNWEEDLRDQEYHNGWYQGVAGIGMFFLEMVQHWIPPAIYGVHILEDDLEGKARPGETASFNLTVKNIGNMLDIITLNIPTPAVGWTVKAEFNGSDVSPDNTRSLIVNMTTPVGAYADENETYEVVVRSATDSKKFDNVSLTTFVEAVYDLDINSSDQSKNIFPGLNVSYEFTVTNTGNADDDISLELSDPVEGWPVIHDFDGIGMKPDEPRAARVQVTSPEDALAGDNFTLRIDVKSKWDPSIVERINITTHVEAIYGLDIPSDNIVDTIRPGENISYEFEVWNTGNVVDDIKLGPLVGADGWATEITFDGKTVPPDERRAVVLQVMASETLLAGDEYRLSINFTSEGSQNITDGILITTSIIPVPRVEVMAPEDKSGLPGKNITYDFIVRNTGNFPDSYKLRVESHEGWPVTLLNGNLTEPIGPRENRTVRIYVIIPSLSPAFTKDVLILWVESEAEPKLKLNTTVNTFTLPVHMLEISLDPNSASVEEGKCTKFVLSMVNKGNIGDLLTIEVFGKSKAWVNQSRTTVEIFMNGSKEVEFIVETGLLVDGKPLSLGYHQFEVVVRSDNVSEKVNFTVTVNALEVVTPVKEPATTQSFWIWILLVLIIAVICVVILVYLWRRRNKVSPGSESGYNDEVGPSNDVDYDDFQYSEWDIEELLPDEEDASRKEE